MVPPLCLRVGTRLCASENTIMDLFQNYRSSSIERNPLIQVGIDIPLEEDDEV